MKPKYQQNAKLCYMDTESFTINNTKVVKIIVPLEYLRNFGGTLEMSLVNCGVNLILTWASTCVITNSAGA